MCDGRDDVFGTGGGIKKTVTIDADRHARFRRGCKGALFKGRSLVSPAGSVGASAGVKPTEVATGDPHPPEDATAPFDGSAVKSAFALLSQKVTKARCFRSGWIGWDKI